MITELLKWIGLTLVLTLPCVIIYVLMAMVARATRRNGKQGDDV